ncbi:GNAT family N-acetyltransferase [Shewanella sp. NIFS-20-20]|uniref:GNAT family N-acetyltransferase n=1 Tax=Shewanella sp. NIFS-20-20 TaxID=2853806 RepID=UPI001C485E13|nr:GNAT family N-acetyltransferase [Shewanella sp. NIFS-20-20]MBV7317125.1 GNAT family N-acetyltransferase [Shewanella sp. NIFS-20-20]
MKAFKVYDYDPEDAHAIAEAFRNHALAQIPTNGTATEVTDARLSASFWRANLQTHYSWVAKQQQQVLGLVSVHFKGEQCFIQFLFVKEGERGVVSALHQVMLHALKQQQVESVYVDADVNAVAFFERRGFARAASMNSAIAANTANVCLCQCIR